MKLLRAVVALRDRLTGRADPVRRVAEMERRVGLGIANDAGLTRAILSDIKALCDWSGPIGKQVDHLLRECPTDYRTLADRLAAVESQAAADRAKLDALDEFARELPTEDEVADIAESFQYALASNLAARFRDLATAIEADRDFEATQEDLESGRIEFADGATLADLGLDADAEDTDADHEPDAEGDTEPSLPAVGPEPSPRCDDCTCDRPE